MKKSKLLSFIAAAILLTACASTPYVPGPAMSLPKPSTLTAVVLPIQDDSAQATQQEIAKAPENSAARNEAGYVIEKLNPAIVPDLTKSGLFTTIATQPGKADVIIQPILKVALIYSLGGAANMRDVWHYQLEVVATKDGKEILRHTYDKHLEIGIGMFSGVEGGFDKPWNDAMGKMMQDLRTDLAQGLGIL
ncbi:MAG: hypothetical protein HYV97_01160 [Bdellovibrio sp.]|nr:hypothetical protein [Bdellovibrio sp.]